MDIGRPALATVAAIVLGATQSLGRTTAPPPAPSPSAGAGLAVPELLERLSGQGYRDVREVERKGDRLYKVGARDAQDRAVELSVDGRTAEVLASKNDDDD
jgi:hypothetical protein